MWLKAEKCGYRAGWEWAGKLREEADMVVDHDVKDAAALSGLLPRRWCCYSVEQLQASV